MTSWSPKAERQGWYTGVGVVGDVRLAGLDQEPVDLVYEPLLGLADGRKDLSASPLCAADTARNDPRATLSCGSASRLPAASLAPSLRSAIRSIDPNLPMGAV